MAAQASILIKKATPQQIRYACMNFHYAKAVPSAQIAFACYENDLFVGVIAYGGGANNNIAKSFGLLQGQVLELVRVALSDKHTLPTSKYVSLTLRLMKKYKPLCKVIISYADLTNQNHKGIIYRACNFLYYGERSTNKGAYYKINGKIIHGRSARAKYGSQAKFPAGWEDVPSMTKYLYVYPIDITMRHKLESKASTYHVEESGAVPTMSHHIKETKDSTICQDEK
jgi:hypothetical protein